MGRGCAARRRYRHRVKKKIRNDVRSHKKNTQKKACTYRGAAVPQEVYEPGEGRGLLDAILMMDDCDIAIESSCSHFHLPAIAELAKVRQRLLRRPHHVLPLAELVGERDEQLAVALALERGEREDAR